MRQYVGFLIDELIKKLRFFRHSRIKIGRHYTQEDQPRGISSVQYFFNIAGQPLMFHAKTCMLVDVAFELENTQGDILEKKAAIRTM